MGAAKSFGLTLITAESCIAGRIAATLTDAPHASDVVHGGFAAYTEVCKQTLGVSAEALRRYTPVNEEAARKMISAGN